MSDESRRAASLQIAAAASLAGAAAALDDGNLTGALRATADATQKLTEARSLLQPDAEDL